MPTITVEQLRKMCTGPISSAQVSNMTSLVDVLNKYGTQFGMDKLYNLSSLLGQVMVESGEFKYDRELWGPTPAQKKYDTRTDLGNTPQKDGDGYKHRGFGPLQLTGAYNQGEFYHWCLRNHTAYGLPVPPDFKKDPTKIVTDPWEGMSVLWYWGFGNPEHTSLNKYSAENNQLMVTKRINGGTTHYDLRLNYQARAALVLLGFGTSKAEIMRFQRTHKMAGTVDGIIGDKTRAAMHKAMMGSNPLTEEVRVQVPVDKPTVPVSVDKEVKKKTSFWGWFVGGATTAGAGLSKILDSDWTTVAAIFGGGILLLVVLLLLRRQLVSAIKDIRQVVEN